jgi:phage terminase large subunit-like protein
MSRHGTRINKLEKDRASRAATEVEVPDDPIAFAESLGIVPDPWQRDLLNATEKFIILNCARQSGKSTIVAIGALYHALTNPGSLVLILSPTQRQSGELFSKITKDYRDSGARDGRDVISATTLQLKNGSRIVSLLGQNRPSAASAHRLSC